MKGKEKCPLEDESPPGDPDEDEWHWQDSSEQQGEASGRQRPGAAALLPPHADFTEAGEPWSAVLRAVGLAAFEEEMAVFGVHCLYDLFDPNLEMMLRRRRQQHVELQGWRASRSLCDWTVTLADLDVLQQLDGPLRDVYLYRDRMQQKGFVVSYHPAVHTSWHGTIEIEWAPQRAAMQAPWSASQHTVMQAEPLLALSVPDDDDATGGAGGAAGGAGGAGGAAGGAGGAGGSSIHPAYSSMQQGGEPWRAALRASGLLQCEEKLSHFGARCLWDLYDPQIARGLFTDFMLEEEVVAVEQENFAAADAAHVTLNQRLRGLFQYRDRLQLELSSEVELPVELPLFSMNSILYPEDAASSVISHDDASASSSDIGAGTPSTDAPDE
jgi:hypothetical protein